MLTDEFLGGASLPFPIIVLRLAGAGLLCALIGYEREASRHAAGLRTHMIVGLAAASYALITLQLIATYGDRGPGLRMDPIRLVEATTAGVAFLAAGMIVMSRRRVKNLTTGQRCGSRRRLGLPPGWGSGVSPHQWRSWDCS